MFKLKEKQEIAPNKVKFSQRVLVGIILIGMVVGVIGVNALASLSFRREVEIVTLKDSVPKDGLILKENLQKDTMVRAEYNKKGIVNLKDGTKRRSIILWEDRDRIVNSYADTYVQANDYIHWSDLTKETPKENAYLYNMEGELLSLDVDVDTLGELLVVGDKVNIRVGYTDNNYTLPTEEEFLLSKESGNNLKTAIGVQGMLFNEARVVDMLNSEGKSIFDAYYKLTTLPKKQQVEMLNSEEFKQLTKPSKMLLVVTAEEADKYMQIQNKSPKFMVTLLPRTGNNLILDTLAELDS